MIKKNQIWKSKTSNKTIRIVQKWSKSGNKHWVVEDVNRKNCSHHIHEGTLLKFYELLEITNDNSN
jgi:hypothetical protein